MKTVELNKLDYWGWECPDCQEWNETQEYPTYGEVFCRHCNSVFKAEEG